MDNTMVAARRTDPATSHEAAASVSTFTITRTRQNLLDMLRLNPRGLTDEQMANMLVQAGIKFTPSGLRSRRKELVTAGLVRDSGRRAKTRANRNTIVWCLDHG